MIYGAPKLFTVISLIFDKSPDRPQSRPNQTSYRKLYFTEFFQNSLRLNMGIILLTSDLMEAARGQKHPSDAKDGMKESIY
jgi:hypothetical protein